MNALAANRVARTLTSLACIARTLDQNPNHPMTDTNRHTLGLRYSSLFTTDNHTTIRDIFNALPPVRPTETQTQYATRIRNKIHQAAT